jgi:hypothetical protein
MQQSRTRACARAIVIVSMLVLANSGLAAGQETDTTQSMEAITQACVPPQPPIPEPNEKPPPGVIDCPIVNGAIQAQVEVRAHGCGLTATVWGTFAPGPGPEFGKTTTQPNILYVVDQDGPLWAIDTNTGSKTLFINTRPFLVPLGAFGPGTYDERGFLGAAFHPDYQVPGSPGFGKFYTYTSEPPGTILQDTHNHFNVIREWQAADPLTPPAVHACPDESAEPPPDEAAPNQAVMLREVLRVEWPQFNHNGGAIFFGTRPADRRLLYVTTGDGGCADDQNLQQGFQLTPPCTGHGAGSEATAPNRAGNGQNPAVPWGKTLQMDPLVTASATVAEDSPLLPTGVTPKAFGLRNPWRASSDRFDLGGSGDIWVSDVGQNQVEEVDHIPDADLTRPTLCPTQGTQPVPLPNFGWHWKEGTFLFNPNLYVLFNPPSDGFVYANAPCSDADMLDPMAEYDHLEGTAVQGGFVYRGSDPDLQQLKGRYVFGDWSRRFLNGEGEVFYLDETDSTAQDPNQRHDPRIFFLTNGPLSGNTFVFGFGEDAQGNLYVMGNETGIPFKETGIMGKIVRRCAQQSFRNGFPASPDCRD